MNIMNILEPLLYTVITAAIPMIATYITKFLSAKKEQINAEMENEQLKNHLNTALEAVNNAVLTISQTYTDSLKGTEKWTRTAQLEAKNKAIETATTLITNDVKKAIEKLYGDFDQWLDSSIEKYVNINK